MAVTFNLPEEDPWNRNILGMGNPSERYVNVLNRKEELSQSSCFIVVSVLLLSLLILFCIDKLYYPVCCFVTLIYMESLIMMISENRARTIVPQLHIKQWFGVLYFNLIMTIRSIKQNICRSSLKKCTNVHPIKVSASNYVFSNKYNHSHESNGRSP